MVGYRSRSRHPSQRCRTRQWRTSGQKADQSIDWMFALDADSLPGLLDELQDVHRATVGVEPVMNVQVKRLPSGMRRKPSYPSWGAPCQVLVGLVDIELGGERAPLLHQLLAFIGVRPHGE